MTLPSNVLGVRLVKSLLETRLRGSLGDPALGATENAPLNLRQVLSHQRRTGNTKGLGKFPIYLSYPSQHNITLEAGRDSFEDLPTQTMLTIPHPLVSDGFVLRPL